MPDLAPGPIGINRKARQQMSQAQEILEGIDNFIVGQMSESPSGLWYTTTYSRGHSSLPLPKGNKGGKGALKRADTYDTSVATIYLSLRGRLTEAGYLADGLCRAHDQAGGGPIAAALYADDHTKVLDGHIDVGNMCWAGIALSRLNAMTKENRYRETAESIGRWVISNCTVRDSRGGFSGGLDDKDSKRTWRSIEHNADAFAFFRNLYLLTGDDKWKDASEHARKLIAACYVGGRYVTGTGPDGSLNDAIVPTDAQSWTALSMANSLDGRFSPSSGPRFDAAIGALDYMNTSMSARETTGAPPLTFDGFKFSEGGTGVQNEATAGAAMALYAYARYMFERQDGLDQGSSYQGNQIGRARAQIGTYWSERATLLLDSLESQIRSAPGTDGKGVVATPSAEATSGLGWSYFNWLHVAASAWTGLALLYEGDRKANPFAPVL